MKWSAMTILAFALIATNAVSQETTKEINPVPVKLMPPEGHTVLFKTTAEGVQIYVCNAKADADLFDEQGRRIGRHFAGPTWEALEDGSNVIGTLIEKTDAPKTGDIPWLLLKRKSGAGKGRFSRVTYIQHVDTEGGVAPPGTPEKSRQGEEVRVKYKATYVFYCAKG
jgi:hypothetical protein